MFHCIAGSGEGEYLHYFSSEKQMIFFPLFAAAAAKSLQSCPTLCDPTDGSHQAPPSLGFSRPVEQNAPDRMADGDRLENGWSVRPGWQCTASVRLAVELQSEGCPRVGAG